MLDAAALDPNLGRCPGQSQSHSLTLRRGSFDLASESGQLLRRERAQERFENDFRLAQTGIEVIVKAIQYCPAIARGRTCGDIPRGLVEFSFELRDGAGENPQLVNKTLPVAKDNIVKDSIPGCGRLCGMAAKEVGIERFYARDLTDVPPAVGERFTKADQRRG